MLPSRFRCRTRRTIVPGRSAARLPVPAVDAPAFAKTLGKSFAAGELCGTHRRPKRNYVRRVRTPSMLDARVATIESWLAAAPQLTALAIADRLSELYTEQVCKKQHSIVQRMLRALRKKVAERLMAEIDLTQCLRWLPCLAGRVLQFVTTT